MAKSFVYILILLLAATTAIAQPPVPQLPRVYIDTTFSAPTGSIWRVHTSTAFQSALTSSQPGDIIVLDAGVTYSGNFTYPAKANPSGKWTYIISSAIPIMSGVISPLPEHVRVSPASASLMPKILTPNASAALKVAAGANHLRLVGLEITTASTQGCNPNNTPPVNCFSYQLVWVAGDITGPMPDSITIDRSYLHGSPTMDLQHAILGNGRNMAVIDSYISDIHIQGFDASAFNEYATPGPIKIVNNFLSASSEDVQFGGGGGVSNPYVASDIEFRNNYLYKPLSWDAVGVSIPPNPTMVVKNNLEFKSARRVIVDGNLFENVWVSGQTGFSLVLTVRTNQSGNVAVVDDILVQNNIFKNVASGFQTLAFDPNCLAANGCSNQGEEKRVVLRNNLFLLGDTRQLGYNNGYNYAGFLQDGLTDFVFQHNTIVPPPDRGYCGGQGSVNFNVTPPFNQVTSHTHNVWILDNVLCRQIDGPRGFVGQFPYVLQEYMGDPAPVSPRLYGNVMYAPPGDRVYSVPPHEYVTTLPVAYTNPNAGSFQLSSPVWTDTSDGQLAGVNMAALPAHANASVPSNAPGAPQPSVSSPQSGAASSLISTVPNRIGTASATK